MRTRRAARGRTQNHARSIWPGPECRDRKPGWRLWDIGRDHEITLRTTQGLNVNGHCVVDGAVRWGIALGHVRARARMERFVAWCRAEARNAGYHQHLIDDAERHWSPEAAVEHAAAIGWSWPFVLVSRVANEPHDTWHGRRLGAPRDAWRGLGQRLVRSPEWASLPWQAESSEVSHG